MSDDNERAQLETRIKITREKISELVWSKPLAQAAEELGVTSRSLISMCNIFSVARPKQSYWVKVAHAEAQTAKKSISKTHRLIADAILHFDRCRPTDDDGYLRPYKKSMVDVITSKDCLNKALGFASDLFKSLEHAHHRVMLAPEKAQLDRVSIGPYEGKREPQVHHYGLLWWPHTPTVVYIGGVAIGLGIIEISERTTVREINGKYIREDDHFPPNLRSYHTDISTKVLPSGRLRLFAYCPDWRRVKWSMTWDETKDRSLQSILKSIVKSLIGAAADLVSRLEEADRKDEIERLERLAAEDRRAREEDHRRVEQSIRESHEHLSHVIAQWASVMNTERFLLEAERRANGLPETERSTVIERLELARKLLGTQDPLDFLRSWATPEERYQRRYCEQEDGG